MIAYTIVFQDEDLLVVDKPAGWSVTRQHRGQRATEVLVEQLREDLGETITPVHRIDDDVGGLVVCAKTKPGLDFLSGQFQSKTAERVYRALAVVATEEEAGQITGLPLVREIGGGLPSEFEVSYALAPDEHVAGRMHVYRRKGGRPAHTRFTVLEDFGRFVWLEARPETSRQMQVQAHLAAVGAPVLGDGAHGLPEVQLLLSNLKRGYKGRGEEKPMVEGLALQAAELTLKHPQSRETVSFELPPPKSFEIALKNLRKFSRSR